MNLYRLISTLIKAIVAICICYSKNNGETKRSEILFYFVEFCISKTKITKMKLLVMGNNFVLRKNYRRTNFIPSQFPH